MKSNTNNKVRIQLTRCVNPAWLTLLVAAAALGSSGSTQAAERRQAIKSTDLPYYARIERAVIPTDGEWAAIAFYRPPECVRPDFNLLDFFDIPAAFGCEDPDHPYLVGFAIYMSPGPGIPPVQQKLQLAPDQTLPVWFVEWSELETAIADDTLTIGELADLPSLLKGEAVFFTETLHPAAKICHCSLVASGYLEDGRRFQYQLTRVGEELPHVRIEFK